MKNLLIVCCVLLQHISYAQTSIPKTIKVFIDCSNGGECYPEFIRQEIPVVDFVRDRLDADVHVVVTAIYNSSGSAQYVLHFIGRNGFSKYDDTIQYSVPPAANDDEKRKSFTCKIKIGLLPCLNKTIQAEKILVSFGQTKQVDSIQENKDPWNAWVFQLSANGNMNGNQNYFFGGLYFNVSAYKETETQKMNMYVSTSQETQKYVDDGTTYKYDFQSYYLGLEHYKKMSQHIGLGAEVNASNSLYSNYKARIKTTVNMEYSIFPYKDFNTKRWVVIYSIGPLFNQYYDSTIYLKSSEFLFTHNLGSICSFIQPWGSVNMGVFWSNLLNDFKKNNLSLNGALQFKIAKGLNFAVWGNYTFVHDQINIRKGDIDLNQLLVKNQELLSSYDYNLGIGISYRFGSKYNSAVNPAFRGLNYSINL